MSVSTHDLVGDGFAVLAGATGDGWVEAASAVAAATGLPVRGYRVAPDGALTDTDGELERLLGIGADGAVVVRPDGVIGARMTGGVNHASARFAAVMEQLTSPVAKLTVPSRSRPQPGSRRASRANGAAGCAPRR